LLYRVNRLARKLVLENQYASAFVLFYHIILLPQ
jgi:hypothetical protein